ncbi:MAG: efflux transporter, family, subunit [Myxococcales bacterium]|nr:efflux transporter, family, subunit [Myxococcales bacterium]
MRKSRPTGLYLLGVAGVLATMVGVGVIWNGRTASARAEAETRRAEVSAGPRVELASAKMSSPLRRIELQGEARPFASVTLYAKVSGYLKQMLVDKGDHVRANQTVAVIQSQELDQQYDAAVADAKYKQAEARRAASLAGPGVISARQAELEESQAHVATAQVAALETQRSYQTLRAPFAGTVTARFADPGALVQSAANAQTGALPVVTISQIDRLRVYVYVDQRDAAFVHVGDAAEVQVPDRPEAKRIGKVARLASELDPKTRMMLVEVDIDNAQADIVAGSFVQVVLSIVAPRRVEIPAAAMVIRDHKQFVAVVNDGVVAFRPVQVTDDDGALVRLERGLKEGEHVALNLGDSVAEGARVRPVEEGHAAAR